MDSNTTLAWGIFILFCFILFVIVKSNKRKKTKQYLLPLNELAKDKNCTISRYDIWSGSVIGIDETQNIVFAIRKTKEKEIHVVVNLDEIFRCRLAEASHTSGAKGGNIKAFDRIDLVFSNKDKSKADVVVEIYNVNTDRLTLTGELQLAERWCTLVNNKIASTNK